MSRKKINKRATPTVDASIIKHIPITTHLKLELPYILLSLILGSIFTLYLCGTMVIDPTQVNLPYGDINLTFLLSAFFSHDTWHWPLWYTNSILYPLGTNVEPPLTLVILKLISPLLPRIFVYTGYLAIINSTLQFYIGFCIFRTLRTDKILAILGGLFVLCASFFAWRFFRHFDLTFHWLILLAIFLVVKPAAKSYKLNFYYFLILLFATIGLAHPYMGFMIYGIGIGQIFKLIYEKFGRLEIKPLSLMLIALSLTFLFGFYCFGYFDMGNTTALGFGLYKSCLLGFFTPPFNTFFITFVQPAVTYIYPDPGMDYYEGECYLGLGIIILIILALFIYPKLLKKNIFNHKYMALTIMLVVMFLFSLSSSVYLTPNISLFTFSIPDIDFIKKICSTLRSSGRFSWPLGYAITITSIILFYDYMQARKKLAYSILSIIFMIQVFDLSKMFYSIHDSYFRDPATITRWNDDLSDKFWYNISNKYKHLIVLDRNHEKFAYLAVLNNMTINMFSLSRTDPSIINLQQQAANNFFSNNLEEDSLYIISQRVYDTRNINMDPAECKPIDNYIVCTKEWK